MLCLGPVITITDHAFGLLSSETQCVSGFPLFLLFAMLDPDNLLL